MARQKLKTVGTVSCTVNAILTFGLVLVPRLTVVIESEVKAGWAVAVVLVFAAVLSMLVAEVVVKLVEFFYTQGVSVRMREELLPSLSTARSPDLDLSTVISHTASKRSFAHVLVFASLWFEVMAQAFVGMLCSILVVELVKSILASPLISLPDYQVQGDSQLQQVSYGYLVFVLVAGIISCLNAFPEKTLKWVHITAAACKLAGILLLGVYFLTYGTEFLQQFRYWKLAFAPALFAVFIYHGTIPATVNAAKKPKTTQYRVQIASISISLVCYLWLFLSSYLSNPSPSSTHPSFLLLTLLLCTFPMVLSAQIYWKSFNRLLISWVITPSEGIGKDNSRKRLFFLMVLHWPVHILLALIHWFFSGYSNLFTAAGFLLSPLFSCGLLVTIAVSYALRKRRTHILHSRKGKIIVAMAGIAVIAFIGLTLTGRVWVKRTQWVAAAVGFVCSAVLAGVMVWRRSRQASTNL